MDFRKKDSIRQLHEAKMKAKNTYLYFILISVLYVNVESIGGGDYISITEAPYYVLIPTGCGGAILSEYWVITAAHCTGNVTLAMGVTSGKSTLGVWRNYNHRVKKVIVHPDYELEYLGVDNLAYLRNDIALLKLEEPIAFDEYRQPIKISKTAPTINDTITVIGLGQERISEYSSLALKKTQLRVIVVDNDIASILSFGIFATGNYAQACHGDSGGPVVMDNQLMGTVSTVYNCRSFKGHLRHYINSGFTQMSAYYDWIIKKTGIEY